MSAPDHRRARILGVVLEILDSEGYEAVQVREVAARARVSLTKIYELFGNREGLIIAAVSAWMAEHAYADVPVPEKGDDLYECTAKAIRAIFAPWEAHPNMLAAFYRARTSADGGALHDQGALAVGLHADAWADVDPQERDDVELIVGQVAFAAMTAFVAGAIDVKEIVPILERTLRRLATGRP